MTCDEMRWAVDDAGAEVWAMTYNGSVPGRWSCAIRTTTSS